MDPLNNPVTFGDLLDAIEGMSTAFGKALHIATAELGADAGQRKRIAKALHAMATHGSGESPEAHSFTGMTTGFLAGLE